MVIMALYNPVREIYISTCLHACVLVCLCDLLNNYIAHCFNVSFKQNILGREKKKYKSHIGDKISSKIMIK